MSRTVKRTDSTDWAAHCGHRLTAMPNHRSSDTAVDGTCIACLDCDVTLAFHPVGEPPPEVASPPVAEVIQVAAGLRQMMHEARPPAAPPGATGAPGFAFLGTDGDPYWRGYRDGAWSGQEVTLGHLAHCLEDLAARHVPAPEGRTAHHFVRAKICEHLRARERAEAARRPPGRPLFEKPAT